MVKEPPRFVCSRHYQAVCRWVQGNGITGLLCQPTCEWTDLTLLWHHAHDRPAKARTD